MFSKVTISLVFCLASGSAVLSLPILESRSHHHAGGVAVVTQTTTTTTTVTSVAVDDKPHHHHHHHNSTVAAVEPTKEDTPAETTPSQSPADTSSPTLEARWWFDGLFSIPSAKPHTAPDSEGTKSATKDANCNQDAPPPAEDAAAPVSERSYYFDDELD